MIVFISYSLFLNKHVLHVDDDPCYASTDDKYGQLMNAYENVNSTEAV